MTLTRPAGSKRDEDLARRFAPKELEITLFGEKLVFKTGGEGSFTLNWFYATDSCGHPGPSDFILRQNVTKIFCDRKCEKCEMDGWLKAT